MQGQRWTAAAIVALSLGSLALGSGCATDEPSEAARHAELMAAGDTLAAAKLFHADVEFYRRYAKPGWKLDRDREFTIKDESQIRANVTFHNLRADRTYSVHLVWIKPDGGEAFRRYAEVTRREVGLPAGVAPDSSGVLPSDFLADLGERYGTQRAETIGERLARHPDRTVPVTETTYKTAEEIVGGDRSFSLAQAASATVESRFNISREKERMPGRYLLRIYLDRALFQEVPFTILDPA